MERRLACRGGTLALILVPVLCAAGGAAAEDRPLDNSGLPNIEDIRPLYGEPDAGLIHNAKIVIETGYSRAQHIDQPTELDQSSLQTSVGLSAGIGQYGFAGISGTWSHETISSTNLAFAMPISAGANVVGGDAVIGINPTPFLSLGVIGGLGRGSASYQFIGIPAAPAMPADSTTRRLGAFLSAFYAKDRLLLSATGTVIDVRTDQDYGPLNVPQFDSYGATLLLAELEAGYALTDRLDVSAGVTLNQVLSQVVPAAQTGLDSTWFTLEGGLQYQATSNVTLFAKASTWIGNDRMSFGRVAVGASYGF